MSSVFEMARPRAPVSTDCARADRGACAYRPVSARSLTRLHNRRRSAHAVGEGVQRAPQDAGRAATAVKLPVPTTRPKGPVLTVLSRAKRRRPLKRVPQEPLIAHFAGIAAPRRSRSRPSEGPAGGAADRLGARRAFMLGQGHRNMAAGVDAAQSVRDCWAWPIAAAVLNGSRMAMKGDAPRRMASDGEMHDFYGAITVVILQGPALSSRTGGDRLRWRPRRRRERPTGERDRVSRWPPSFTWRADAGLDDAAERPARKRFPRVTQLRAAEMADPPMLRSRPALPAMPSRRCRTVWSPSTPAAPTAAHQHHRRRRWSAADTARRHSPSRRGGARRPSRPKRYPIREAFTEIVACSRPP